MIFKYDQNKLKQYQKKGTKAIFPFLILGTFIVLPMLYFQMQDFENILFFILMTFVITIIASFIGIIIGNKKAKNEFNSYQIECDEYTISISSQLFSNKIDIEQIDKILKDKNGNIYIVTNKINKTIIKSSYLENEKIFLDYLSNISFIEQHSTKLNFLQFIPIILFLALAPIGRLGNIELYLIFAVLVVLTTAYSLVQLLLDQMRFKHKIMGIIINGFIVIAVSRHIFNVINYLLS